MAWSSPVDPKILKGVGDQIVIWTLCDQVVKVGEGWVEQEFVLLIIAALPNDARAQCYKTFYGRNLRIFVIS
jgi:hypothetical protein